MDLSYPWSVLGIEDLRSTRRLRNLQLTPIIRQFNDLAVPRMGGVWFAKQIYLSCLGIAVAENVNKQKSCTNIQVANAIEALACKIALDKNLNSQPIRGKRKLPFVDDLSYGNLKRPEVYVTQPWRMGTVQCLPALNLTNEANRFNDYKLTESARNLVETYDKNGTGLLSNLTDWVLNKTTQIRKTEIIQSISPAINLNSTQKKLLFNLVKTDEKRLSIMEWSKLTKKSHNWKVRPACISESHWKQMYAGAEFSVLRLQVLELLDKIEHHIYTTSTRKLLLDEAYSIFQKDIKQLQSFASNYIVDHEDPTDNRAAHEFCKECLINESIVEKLIERDGICLRLEDGYILPGPGFEGLKFRTGSENEFDSEDYVPEEDDLPPNISFRVPYMFSLKNDLKYNGQN